MTGVMQLQSWTET